MIKDSLTNSLENILDHYGEYFKNKLFIEESPEVDDLMLVFGLTSEIKAENRQYWGRELGMCWQRLVIELCQQTCNNFDLSLKEGKDELCDLRLGKDAIDTKYRIGSGDSGTLKKFKQYVKRLIELNYQPILLILRNDNLPAAITACLSGGWEIYTGNNAYEYLLKNSQVDLKKWLKDRINRYQLTEK